jgi:hypothetical protein
MAINKEKKPSEFNPGANPTASEFKTPVLYVVGYFLFIKTHKATHGIVTHDRRIGSNNGLYFLDILNY